VELHPSPQDSGSGTVLGRKEENDAQLLHSRYRIERQDSEMIRRKILNISYADWKKRGSSKENTHYLKKNAVGTKPFAINKHVRARLERWG
jgi:CRISPR-associated protein Cas1